MGPAENDGSMAPNSLLGTFIKSHGATSENGASAYYHIEYMGDHFGHPDRNGDRFFTSESDTRDVGLF